MPKNTASAAGGALPAEDLERVADAILAACNLMADAAGLYAEAEAKLASARAALALAPSVDPVFAYAVEVDSECAPDNAGRIAATLLQSPLFADMGGEGAQ